MGPSGCGKTTLLSCIIGRGRLDSGHIQLSVKKKKEIGYMPQVIAKLLYGLQFIMKLRDNNRIIWLYERWVVGVWKKNQNDYTV